MDSAHNLPRVLLAEDDEEMRKTLASFLRSAGYPVIECCDGAQLFKMFCASQRYLYPEGYSLLITDVRMPGLSGLEVLEGFHGKPGFPPVILITAFGDQETHARARILGAIGVLNKPFEVEDLMAMVRDILGHSVATQECPKDTRLSPSRESST